MNQLSDSYHCLESLQGIIPSDLGPVGRIIVIEVQLLPYFQNFFFSENPGTFVVLLNKGTYLWEVVMVMVIVCVGVCIGVCCSRLVFLLIFPASSLP